MTQEKVDSPLPSMVNYPEPTGVTTNNIGFDQTGSRYKVSQGDSSSGDYLIAENVVGSGDISISSPIEWIQSTIQKKSGNLIQSISSLTFELQPGHFYELSALVPLKSDVPSSGTGVQWKWFQGSTALGISGGAFIDTGNWPEEANFRPAITIIKVENTPIQVYVKYTSMVSGPRFRVGNSGYCKIRTIS